MKYNKTIDTLFERARTRANISDLRTGLAILKRRGVEVYRIEYNLNNYTVKLYHYRTMTLYYDLRERDIISWYGESVSDRDSMNTLLHILNHVGHHFRYGTNMGFVIQETEGVI